MSDASKESSSALSPLGSFILLYWILYSAFGAASPFLPAFIEARGVSAEQIGMLFELATAIRLISAPIAGRMADWTHALRATLAICAIGTALSALGYLSAWSFSALLTVSLLHALALAPITNLADALAVVASKREAKRFEYGWVRGAGSAAFIVASIVAGLAVSAFGLDVVIILQAMLMLAVPFAARLVPPVRASGLRKGREVVACWRVGIASSACLSRCCVGGCLDPRQSRPSRHVLDHSLDRRRHLPSDSQHPLVARRRG